MPNITCTSHKRSHWYVTPSFDCEPVQLINNVAFETLSFLTYNMIITLMMWTILKWKIPDVWYVRLDEQQQHIFFKVFYCFVILRPSIIISLTFVLWSLVNTGVIVVHGIVHQSRGMLIFSHHCLLSVQTMHTKLIKQCYHKKIDKIRPWIFLHFSSYHNSLWFFPNLLAF